MTKFQYKALKNKTEFVEGEIEANSTREARQKILALGFMPTKDVPDERFKSFIAMYAQRAIISDK